MKKLNIFKINDIIDLIKSKNLFSKKIQNEFNTNYKNLNLNVYKYLLNEEEEIEIYELQYHKEKNYKIIINFEHNFYFLILTKKKNFISKRKKNEETFLILMTFLK